MCSAGPPFNHSIAPLLYWWFGVLFRVVAVLFKAFQSHMMLYPASKPAKYSSSVIRRATDFCRHLGAGMGSLSYIISMPDGLRRPVLAYAPQLAFIGSTSLSFIHNFTISPLLADLLRYRGVPWSAFIWFLIGLDTWQRKMLAATPKSVQLFVTRDMRLFTILLYIVQFFSSSLDVFVVTSAFFASGFLPNSPQAPNFQLKVTIVYLVVQKRLTFCCSHLFPSLEGELHLPGHAKRTPFLHWFDSVYIFLVFSEHQKIIHMTYHYSSIIKEYALRTW